MYQITQSELSKIQETFFMADDPNQIKDYPTKLKKKYMVLYLVISRLSKDKVYSEPEINESLKQVYFDFVTLRRELIDFHLLERKKDGSAYWVSQELPGILEE